MSVIFEVRIPTYNRPDLLRRAIESLRTQTYPHWFATVFDDAAAGEAVVHSASDGRIRYRRNPQRLGACDNIDQCFSPVPSGGHYGCLLEDDNFLLPDFLSRIVSEVERRPWSLIQVNQRIWNDARGMHPEDETTFGDWFSSGTVEPDQLWASRLVGHGLSNGGLVWRLDGRCSLQVGPKIRHAGLQELCRSLLVASQLLYIRDALAVFTYMPKESTARSEENNRLFGRGEQSMRRFILKRLGAAAVRLALTQKPDIKDHLTWLLAHSGYPHLIDRREIVSRTVAKAYLKGIALRMNQPDPCRTFFSHFDSA